jgi:hypothetical protein
MRGKLDLPLRSSMTESDLTMRGYLGPERERDRERDRDLDDDFEDDRDRDRDLDLDCECDTIILLHHIIISQ